MSANRRYFWIFEIKVPVQTRRSSTIIFPLLTWAGEHEFVFCIIDFDLYCTI